MFQIFTGLYEPSAIQQLPDGRFLVVEDEKQNPFTLATIHPDGKVSSKTLDIGLQESSNLFWKLNDLEAVALDHAGFLYTITSHSRDAEGEEKKSRDKLLRFRIEGEHLTQPLLVNDLKSVLIAAHPIFAAAAQIKNVKTDGGLNIEALEITPEPQRLMIGFRSPLFDQKAVIATVENPRAIFELGEPPHISANLIKLNLGGNGIRSLSYFPSLNGYLIVSGPVASEPVQFQLWFWSGIQGESARRVTVPGLPGFERAEGICPATISGRACIAIVSDDGSREQERFARFLLLDVDQLQISD